MKHIMPFMTALGLVAIASACSQASVSAWTGYIEGEYVYVSSPIAGSLSKLAVLRGQSIANGLPLFELSADTEIAATQEALARLSNAQAQASNTEKGKRADETAVIQAQLSQSRFQLGLTQNNLARQESLVAKGFVSPASMDESRNNVRLAQEKIVELEAALRVAQLPARVDERAAAKASSKAAQAVVSQAQWRQDQKRQSSPTSGTVTETYFRLGEWVPAGQPVVALLPASGTKARFFISERELGGIQIGQKVTIQCDGCAALIPARIDFIAAQAEYTPPIIYSNTQRNRLVFLVEARPIAPGTQQLHPGQPISVMRSAGS